MMARYLLFLVFSASVGIGWAIVAHATDHRIATLWTCIALCLVYAFQSRGER